MHISTRSRRIVGLLTALGAVLVTFASTATAALATINVPLPDGRAALATGFPSPNSGGIYDPVQQSSATAPVVTVVGGMPGWQIALIAIGAALVAAVVAVLAYRAWTARRQPLAAPRFAAARLRSREASDMPQFMDFHDDLKLPAEAIAQITADIRDKRADEFGVRQVELYHNDEGKVYCLLEAPDEEAVRKHHAALGVDCGAVHRVDGIA